MALITRIIILAFTCILLLYNFVMAANKTQNDTIGASIVTVLRENPILVFATGVLVGHLWFN